VQFLLELGLDHTLGLRAREHVSEQGFEELDIVCQENAINGSSK
jgi:hypothetical protein